jgi:hypothetical protein
MDQAAALSMQPVLELQREVLDGGHLLGDHVYAHTFKIAGKVGRANGKASHSDAVRCARNMQDISKAGPCVEEDPAPARLCSTAWSPI